MVEVVDEVELVGVVVVSALSGDASVAVVEDEVASLGGVVTPSVGVVVSSGGGAVNAGPRSVRLSSTRYFFVILSIFLGGFSMGLLALMIVPLKALIHFRSF